MLNFNYSIPTKIFFGKDKIKMLGSEIKKYGSRVLLVYGGGSIKKSGIYSKITQILKTNDINFLELSGINPNPRITSVRKGIQLCRENEIDLVLAVGGGSSIDCAKVIAAGYYYDGDAWDIVLHPRKIKKALPIATILTLAATGSEMNSTAVITNNYTNEKLGTAHQSMTPKFSILDPTYTYTLPAFQTAVGTVDMISHILEVYFSNTNEAYIQNKMAEALLKTCIKYGEIAVKEPENYEARSNLMWTSSLAINGLLSYGKITEWSVHAMEHQLSAYYDITHGAGIAILTPHWMEYILNEKTLDKFVEYGVNIWNIDKNEDKYKIANKAIKKTKEYFISLGLSTSLREVGINEEKLEEMAKKATKRGTLGNFKVLDTEDVLNIFRLSL
ncbi:iron-containing alcohol dehydrogenase [Clostridium sp.]|uniref:iron-containing alcohol dehydrogenase n=1 Tax=Clostridium sp. TaxID=1506 RepID=UPI003D6D115E